MRTGLAVDDLDGFLDEAVVAVLATVRPDGSVLLSPVWHEWRDGGFNVWTGGNDVKSRHLRREPRASIVVAESDFPTRDRSARGGDDRHRLGVRDGRPHRGPLPRPGEGRGVRPHGRRQRRDDQARGRLRAWDFADEEDVFGP